MQRNIGLGSVLVRVLFPTLMVGTVAGCSGAPTSAPPMASDGGVGSTSLLGSGAPNAPPPGTVGGGILGAVVDGGAPTTTSASLPGIPGTPGTVGACSPDTHTTVRFQNRLLDIVTNNGRLYTFEANGAPWPSNGTSLGAITYYANGPCQGQQVCRFDTHTFGRLDGRLYEFVSANGRNWIFDDTGATVDSGSRIASLDRYRDACSGNGECHFETRAFIEVDDRVVETVTVNGRLYQYYRDGSRFSSNGTDLTAIPRYAVGPCAGRAAGSCKLDSRTYGVYENQLVEVVSLGGSIWRWFANDQRPLGTANPIGTQSPFNRGVCN